MVSLWTFYVLIFFFRSYTQLFLCKIVLRCSYSLNWNEVANFSCASVLTFRNELFSKSRNLPKCATFAFHFFTEMGTFLTKSNGVCLVNLLHKSLMLLRLMRNANVFAVFASIWIHLRSKVFRRDVRFSYFFTPNQVSTTSFEEKIIVSSFTICGNADKNF